MQPLSYQVINLKNKGIWLMKLLSVSQLRAKRRKKHRKILILLLKRGFPDFRCGFVRPLKKIFAN